MFYSIKNWISIEAIAMERPWEWTPAQGYVKPVDKAAWQEWCSNPATEHSFISGFEGLTHNCRISEAEQNPPYKLHAIIADYDGAVHDMAALKTELTTKPPSEFLPAWAYKTFSGHLRLVWVFSGPIVLPDHPKVVKAFLTQIDKHVAFRKWFKAFDEQALYSVTKYYENSSDWEPISDKVIPSSLLQLWLFEAAKSQNFTLTSYKVPLDIVANEVEKRWPGRWRRRKE